MKKDQTMAYITFKQENDTGRVVEIKNPNGSTTWMELTDDFVEFLSACGYIVTRDDIVNYMINDQYSLGDVIKDEIQLNLYDEFDTAARGYDTVDVR